MRHPWRYDVWFLKHSQQPAWGWERAKGTGTGAPRCPAFDPSCLSSLNKEIPLLSCPFSLLETTTSLHWSNFSLFVLVPRVSQLDDSAAGHNGLDLMVQPVPSGWCHLSLLRLPVFLVSRAASLEPRLKPCPLKFLEILCLCVSKPLRHGEMNEFHFGFRHLDFGKCFHFGFY